MISIRTAEALARLDAKHPLRQLQIERLADYNLEDIATLVVVEPGDTLDAIARDLGADLSVPELIEHHGRWSMITFILSDDGYGVILYVPSSVELGL